MKLIDLIKKMGGNRAALAKKWNTTEQQINNWVSQDREVVELANGNFIIINKHSRILSV
jgi:transposase-like protein